jgi:hypothetical protein
VERWGRGRHIWVMAVCGEDGKNDVRSGAVQALVCLRLGPDGLACGGG